jgi:DNA-binding MarR family transcriptional regulator
VKGSEGTGNSRVLIRVGDVEIDISGSQREVDAQMMDIREGEQWSTAIAKVRSAREAAISAAVEAAKKSGMPERGSAFRSLIENSTLTKKPDQVLAAIQYLRDVEGTDDSPPRVLKKLFDDSGLGAPDNLSLYLNRLVERGFLTCPPGSNDKNRYAVLTPEGRAHLDRRSGA